VIQQSHIGGRRVVQIEVDGTGFLCQEIKAFLKYHAQTDKKLKLRVTSRQGRNCF